MPDNREEPNYFEHMTNYGIPTPPENEDIGPLDSVSEWVEAMVDEVEHDLVGDEHTAHAKERKTERGK
ncbi:hypothetical protein ACFFK0_26060 [Paenibacillus chartarius]|uniref:Uncharacterized protein n=1 Tax=Paenibacillus chartarius TaxID=747481 RepID=A0ABV6DT65_9BACL